MKSTWQLLLETRFLYQKERALFLGYSAWLLVPALLTLLSGLLPLPANFSAVVEMAISILRGVLGVWIAMVLLFLCSGGEKKKKQAAHAGEIVWHFFPSFVWAELLATLCIIFGLLFFIVPGVIAWGWFAFVSIMVVVEKKRGREALRSSRALVRGRIGSVLWRLLLGDLALLFLYLLGSSALFALATLFGAPPVDLLSINPKDIPAWAEAFMSVIEVLFFPLPFIFLSRFYQDLKATR